MALAPMAYTLWQHNLRFDPDLPVWANRDRFVLSVGHASALLCSMLHLSGVKAVNPDYETVGSPAVALEDLRRFRQLDSKCPGHPEYRWTSGVECTTGPLGTGIATSVGMAMAGLWQAATFSRPGYELFDYDVYALCGDGCLMEGIGAEAASLAEHLRLSNLCWDLRQQQDHHRGQHGSRVQRGRASALRRLWLGGAARRRRRTTSRRWLRRSTPSGPSRRARR
jgi:transketolase